MRIWWIQIANFPNIRDRRELETATIYLTLAVGVRWVNIAREDGVGE
jgi:hypothetical protein